MHTSTQGRNAVQAMIDLALRERAGPVALASIAARQRISLSYLEQLFSRLRRAGLVRSTRGPGGGYTLGRAAGEVSVADIVTAVEDDGQEQATAAAASVPPCWARLQAGLEAVMLKHLSSISLRMLLAEQVALGAAMAEPRVPHTHQHTQKPRAPLALPLALRAKVPNSVFAFGQSFKPARRPQSPPLGR